MANIEADEPPRDLPKRAEIRARVPDEEIAELRDVRFSTAIRGYDRREVEGYMNRVNQVLAELQITAAPESAIRHALAQVSEETKSLLQSAHDAAEDITRRSRSQADDRVQQATREAEELREAAQQEARELREAAQEEVDEIREVAEASIQELQDDVQSIRGERARLIYELRELATHLNEFIDTAEGHARDDDALQPLLEEDEQATEGLEIDEFDEAEGVDGSDEARQAEGADDYEGAEEEGAEIEAHADEEDGEESPA